MARRMTTKKRMEALGTYKPEYDPIISIYDGMLAQYKSLERQFKKDEYKVTLEDGKPNPIIKTMENLRKDIGVFSDKLALNPKSFDKITIVEKEIDPLTEKLEALANEFT